MLFGLEYEALVNIDQSTKQYLQSVSQRVFDDLKHEKEVARTLNVDGCFDGLSDEDKQYMHERIVVASVLNGLTMKIQDPSLSELKEPLFVALTGYHGDVCGAPNSKGKWCVSFDGSIDIRVNKQGLWFLRDHVQMYNHEPAPDTQPYTVLGEVYDYAQDKQKSLIKYIEIVSPILHVEGNNQIVSVKKPASKLTVKSVIENVLFPKDPQGDYHSTITTFHNPNTSNHVHVSFKNNKFTDINNPIVIRIIMAWMYFEPLFMLFVAPWRRMNMYCITMRRMMYKKFKKIGQLAVMKDLFFNFDENGASVMKSFWQSHVDAATFWLNETTALLQTFQGMEAYDRQCAFNLYNVSPDKKGTIEVRLKHGSSDAEEIENWILLIGLFMNAAKNLPCITRSPVMTHNIKSAFWNAYNFDETYGTEVLFGYHHNDNTGNSWLQKRDFASPEVKVSMYQMIDIFRLFLREGNPTQGYNVDVVIEYWKRQISREQPLMHHVVSGGAKKSLPKHVFYYGTIEHNPLISKRIAANGVATTLKHHRIVFSGVSNTYECGMCSIVPCASSGGGVKGMLIPVSSFKEVRAMQQYEHGYKLAKVKVEHKDKNKKHIIQAYTFIAKDTVFKQPPSNAYMRALFGKDHTQKIKVEYVDRLTSKVVEYGHWSNKEGVVESLKHRAQKHTV